MQMLSWLEPRTQMCNVIKEWNNEIRLVHVLADNRYQVQVFEPTELANGEYKENGEGYWQTDSTMRSSVDAYAKFNQLVAEFSEEEVE